LIAESHSRNQSGNTIEGHLYWARFLALERSFAESESDFTQLLNEIKKHLQLAHKICDKYRSQTADMRNEVENVEKMLRNSTFYMSVSNEKKAAVYVAMTRDFRDTEHWYYCENDHSFTIEECDMLMKISQCSQCDSSIDDHDHQTTDDVKSATNLKREFDELRIWSEFWEKVLIELSRRYDVLEAHSYVTWWCFYLRKMKKVEW
jgi:hypothetical protein